MISYITSDQWALAQKIGAEQHAKGVAAGLREYKASRRTGAAVQGQGVAGELAVFNAFGLHVPPFKIGKTDGGYDLVTPAGHKCQVKTPFAFPATAAHYRKYERDDIIPRMNKARYHILVETVVQGAQYDLVGWMTRGTATRCLRLWLKQDGALEDCYQLRREFFNTDWMPWLRANFFDWI